MVTAARAALPVMLAEVAELVRAESPSADPEACSRATDVAAAICNRHLPSPARTLVHDDRPVVRWGSDTPRVLVLGHLDTVWPLGTLERLPWSLTTTDGGTILRGPGCFDMKVGAVQAVHAIAAVLRELPGADVGLLLTTDEEVGSVHSADLIVAACGRAEAALVLEPSIDGSLKSARKGTSWYEFTLHGRAAHAGLDPANGLNSLLAMARLATAITGVADPAVQTTVTPTLATAGTTANTVPDHATLSVDVRAWTPDEQQRVDADLRALVTDPEVTQGVRIDVAGGVNRPAMRESSALTLLARLDRICPELGLAYPGARAVGGASDGNLTAAAGVPTLDGLGAVGDGAHADTEWALAEAIPERTAMLTALILDLLA